MTWVSVLDRGRVLLTAVSSMLPSSGSVLPPGNEVSPGYILKFCERLLMDEDLEQPETRLLTD